MKLHQGHIAEIEYHSMYHNGLFRTTIPNPKEITIPAAKAAVDKTLGKLNNLLAWNENIVPKQT